METLNLSCCYFAFIIINVYRHEKAIRKVPHPLY